MGGSSYVSCSAAGCRYRRSKRRPLEGDRPDTEPWRILHQFPQNAQKCIAWIKACGNVNLLSARMSRLHRKYFVCGRHFLSSDYVSYRRRLRPDCVPSVFDHNVSLSDEVMSDFAALNDLDIDGLPRLKEQQATLTPPPIDHTYCIQFAMEHEKKMESGNSEYALIENLISNLLMKGAQGI